MSFIRKTYYISHSYVVSKFLKNLLMNLLIESIYVYSAITAVIPWLEEFEGNVYGRVFGICRAVTVNQ